MGHHLFQTVLKGEAQKAWSVLIKGGRAQVDLRDVMRLIKPGEDTSDFADRIVREDPILALQLHTLMWDPSYADLGFPSLEKIRRYLDDGGDPIVIVPSKPITGYAAKNPEEAFCETLGIAVGYGPRTLLPAIKAWFQRFIPNVKWESVGWEGALLTQPESS
jgi:hypothetical protein